MTDPGELAGLSLADAIRRALATVGDDVGAAVAWLADHGRPGVKRQRVCDVLARDGRPVGKPRPQPAPGAPSRPTAATRRKQASGEAARLAAAWAAEAPPASWRDTLEGEAPGETCRHCPGPMHWTGARTMLVCPSCRKYRPSAGARQRAAEVADSWAPRRSGNRAATPAERAEAAEAAAVARDRIEGYREQLHAIPRGDGQRAAAIAAEHKLGRLVDMLDGAETPAEVEAIEAREDELTADGTGELDAVLSHAERLAADAERARQREARRSDRERGPWLRLGRARDGAYQYDDQADDDQADDDQGGGGPLTTNAPLCEPCYRARVLRPATMRVDPFGRDGQQGRDVCDAHSREYPASVQIVTTYPRQLSPGEQAARLDRLMSGPAPLALAAPVAPVLSFWDRYDQAAAQRARRDALAAQRTGGPRP